MVIQVFISQSQVSGNVDIWDDGTESDDVLIDPVDEVVREVFSGKQGRDGYGCFWEFSDCSSGGLWRAGSR